MTSSAVLSEDGVYRYHLTREWGPGDRLGFIMLNPSTADASADDPTIRKCMGFARQWHFDGIEVGNLFTYRTKDPAQLRQAASTGVDVIGPENDSWLELLLQHCPIVVAAWGCSHGGILKRDHQVIEQLLRGDRQVLCLSKTKAGCPRHPLYAPYHVMPVDYP